VTSWSEGVARTTNPAAAAPTWSNQAIGTQLQALSCVSASVCLVTDSEGNVLLTTEASAAAPHWVTQHLTEGLAPLTAAGCSNAGVCALGDVLGNVITGVAVPASETPPGTAPHETPTTGIVKPLPLLVAVKPRCTLKPASSRVLLAARHRKDRSKLDALVMTVRCDQSATLRLKAKVLVKLGHRRRVYVLPSISRAVPAGRNVTILLKLPAPARAALGRHRPESVSLVLSVQNANGTPTAAATIAHLSGVR
jgi:hypothetical protein